MSIAPLHVENLDQAYSSVAYTLLGTTEDFSADGATYGVLVSNSDGDQQLLWNGETQVTYDGRDRRMEALETIVRQSRKAGENPVAVYCISNFWFVRNDEESTAPAGSWPSQSKNRKSGRQVVIVDTAGNFIHASRTEIDPNLNLSRKVIGPNNTQGLLPSQMLAAIRATTAPRCYMCHQQQGHLRPFGPVFTETNTFSGMWSCETDEAIGNTECQARADRKFTKAQQHQHLRKAFKAMLAICPPDVREEQRLVLEGLLGSKL